MTDQGAMPAYPEWIACSELLPERDRPVIVAWDRAPWLREPTPYVCVHAVCLTDAGDDMNTWASWEGEPFPVGDDMEWDEPPTHWQPWPKPPAALSDQPTRQEDA